MSWLIHGIRRWIIWRNNLRTWRKCLDKSPKLAHCWRDVKDKAEIRRGYFAIEGEIITLEQLASKYREHLTSQEWYPKIVEYSQKGWDEFAEINLFYLIKGRPNDQVISTLIVSTLDKRLVGIMPGYLSGY